METYYAKKNIYHRNNFYNEYKSNGIIYPNLKTKISTGNNELMKYINDKKFSNKYIFSKAKNKVKAKRNINADLYKMSAKKINLSLPKNLNSTNKVNNIKQTTFVQTQNMKNNLKNHNSADKFVSELLLNNEKKYRNMTSNKITISKENNIFIQSKRENKKDKNEKKETIDSIYELWNYLYVPRSYRELFNVILHQLEEEDKNKIIENEYNELNELKSDIDGLLCVIKMRKDILKDLKEMNNKLRLIFKTDAEESNSLLVKQMSNKIEKMRNYTISICFYMKKIKNKIYDGKRIGKYDIDIIANKFEFDINYLIKMKEEMNFLKDGYAKYFFNIMEDQTPFLVKASEEDPCANGDPFIHLIPMSKETKNKIDQCNYIIYQELIGYQNKDFIDNKFRPISPMRNYNNNDKHDISLNSSTFKSYNNNLLLHPIKASYKKAIFENDFINKFSKDNNNKSRNLLLKENSCINFEIKNNDIENLLNAKIKKNDLIVCSNINATLGGKNININVDYYKDDPNVSNIKK